MLNDVVNEAPFLSILGIHVEVAVQRFACCRVSDNSRVALGRHEIDMHRWDVPAEIQVACSSWHPVAAPVVFIDRPLS